MNNATTINTVTTITTVTGEAARAALLASTVERLAKVKAEISALRVIEGDLKQVLIDSGESAVDAHYYRASISECAGKETTDWATIAMRFNPSRQLIKAHTTPGASYFSVRVYARKSS